ncbi:MAG: DUF1559 domain-containing protein [Capsulimonadaceae bacterium]|nr:DUF1559 domain-containing protein [Capsulimonadaceae bacterium]
MKRQGLTLIELLVVIAIIAILAAILFPVFATAREKARMTTCASNLKQLGLAMTQYSQDYDEALPITDDLTYGGNVNCGLCGWSRMLYPYVKSTNVFLCPDDTGADYWKDTDVVSYAMNMNLETQATLNGNTIWTPLIMSQFGAPSLTVAFFEVTNAASAHNYGYTTTAAIWSPAGSKTGAGTSSSPAWDRAFSPSGNGLDSPSNNTLFGANGDDASGNVAPFLSYATGLLGNACIAATSIAPSSCNRNSSAVSGISYYASSNYVGRHQGGGANFLLADGHVKYLMPNTVCAGNDTYYTWEGTTSYYASCVPRTGSVAVTTACAQGGGYAATFAWH